MESPQFMVFSIDDGQIQCVQMLEESLMLIATQKSILLHDLCTSTTLATCQHQQSQYKPNNNINQTSLNNQQNPTQITKQHQSAIEIHYFPIQASVKQNNSNSITIGRLVVHYKMKGIAVYDINKIVTKTNNVTQKLFVNDDDDYAQRNQMFEIMFNNFTSQAFGSAFLKFAFNNLHYEGLQASLQISQITKSTLLQSHQIPINHLQTALSDIQRFKDYKLSPTKFNNKGQFYIFTNQNELYEVKRMKLSEQDGGLVMMQRYQLDEESAEFSLGTVTGMAVVGFRGQEGQLRQLIVAMQGGNVFSYQLPTTTFSTSNSNIQHYLEPSKTLHLQQQLKSLTPTLTSSINNQSLDYSIIAIEMIHDGLGLIVVRKLGVWVVDFRQMKVVVKVEGRRSKGNGNDGEDGEDMTGGGRDKRMYQFNDARMIKLIDSQISTKTTLLKKQTLISSTLILSTKNKLLKLTFTITINKEFDTNKIYQQSIQISKAKFTTIEQINTNLIEDMKMVQSAVSNQEGENIQEAKNKVIQIYGHYQQDKVFHLFL